MKIVDVEMHDVEFVSDYVLEHFIEHHEMMCDLIDATSVESQRFWAARNQIRRRNGIAARKQSDFMPLLHEFFGQIGNDPLGPTVELWRHAFVKR